MMKNQEKSYEENIQKLEGIIHCLEQGNISLEEGLSCFEEGVSLIKSCQKQLERVSEKMQILNQEGSLQEMEQDTGEE